MPDGKRKRPRVSQVEVRALDSALVRRCLRLGIPVVVGTLVFGCGIRLMDDILDTRTNPHAKFLVLPSFPKLANGEGDWITLLAGIPATLIVRLLVVSRTSGRKRS